jgi:hypothetical protein
MKHKSLNQLLCAATVNARFREALLADPAKAIAAGYFDQTFRLSAEERDLVVGIRATQLEDFAAQVYHWISLKAHGNGHNGNGSRNGNGNGYKVNGNGRNGHGLTLDALELTEELGDVYCAPALARA